MFFGRMLGIRRFVNALAGREKWHRRKSEYEKQDRAFEEDSVLHSDYLDSFRKGKPRLIDAGSYMVHASYNADYQVLFHPFHLVKLTRTKRFENRKAVQSEETVSAGWQY